MFVSLSHHFQHPSPARRTTGGLSANTLLPSLQELEVSVHRAEETEAIYSAWDGGGGGGVSGPWQSPLVALTSQDRVRDETQPDPWAWGELEALS